MKDNSMILITILVVAGLFITFSASYNAMTNGSYFQNSNPASQDEIILSGEDEFGMDYNLVSTDSPDNIEEGILGMAIVGRRGFGNNNGIVNVENYADAEVSRESEYQNDSDPSAVPPFGYVPPYINRGQNNPGNNNDDDNSEDDSSGNCQEYESEQVPQVSNDFTGVIYTNPTTLNRTIYPSVCINNSKNLTQFSCNNNDSVQSAVVNCPYGCLNGSCILEDNVACSSSSCENSCTYLLNVTHDYYNKNTIVVYSTQFVSGKRYTDVCAGAKKLTKYSCSENDTMSKETYTCANGCKQGQCIADTTPQYSKMKFTCANNFLGTISLPKIGKEQKFASKIEMINAATSTCKRQCLLSRCQPSIVSFFDGKAWKNA